MAWSGRHLHTQVISSGFNVVEKLGGGSASPQCSGALVNLLGLTQLFSKVLGKVAVKPGQLVSGGEVKPCSPI